jgi:hypothetical protein
VREIGEERERNTYGGNERETKLKRREKER